MEQEKGSKIVVSRADIVKAVSENKTRPLEPRLDHHARRQPQT